VARRNDDEGLSALLSTYKGIVHAASDAPEREIPVLPTTSWNLHHVIGLPGIPKGHIIELFGHPETGKTTLANFIMMCGQKDGGKPTMFIDVERKYGLDYAQNCGVDIDSLYLAYPEYGEQALQIMLSAVLSKKFSVVVLDSVAALVMKSMLDADLTDRFIGLEAQINNRAVKMMAVAKTNSDTVIIFLNQIRKSIGVMFGASEHTPGGTALEYLSSLRLRVSRAEKIESAGKQRGFMIRITCHKNQVGGETYRTGFIPLIKYKGIWPPLELLLTAKRLGLVTGASGNYKLKAGTKEVSLGRGQVNAAKAIMKYGDKLTPRIEKLLLKEEAETKMRILD